ncbi:hypothetical protein [Streptomyces sp. NBC_01190]|uniref:hypothetical protein n=1 Tax=Streptomyces sp. NBC_01190 TaxID=2903767 RepID=UPI003870D19C|nr:hypothetical protein OG519_10620 [Streptomyces sp. NBC_01190]
MTTPTATTRPAPRHRPALGRRVRRARRGAFAVLAAPLLLWLAAPAADAHPLGNFTVNRYDGLTVHRDRVDDLAVVDTAEIPTLQAGPAMDTDHDGRLSPSEAAAHARTACASLADRIEATAGPDPRGPRGDLRFRPVTATFRLVRGQAGLDTGRLECRLTAAARLGAGGTLRLATGVDAGHIGWHEITARGDGVRIGSADVPAVSVSDALRGYPADLLANPLDSRRAEVTLGAGPGAVAATAPGTGWLGSWYAALDRRLGALTDRDRLTLPVGLLAVLMAMVLGAGHAALPGHGKTVMAAYLAGREGRPRDAVTVAGTVTLTHTGSVLALGAALSVSSALVGEDVLAWLGALSGIVIAGAGLWLLPAALRRLHTGAFDQPAGHGHGHGHSHGHGHGHGHAVAAGAEGHDHGRHGLRAVAAHGHAHTVPSARTSTTPDRQVPAGVALADHASDHAHQGQQAHAHDQSHAHSHDHAHPPTHHTHSHPGRPHHHGPRKAGARRGLIGIGVAGGLVPSPSALVVLLGSVALGRTAFGVVLVLCYGLGMAATLAAAGLLLLTLRDRIPALGGARPGGLIAWSTRVVPLGTALLILAVGLGTALRALPL